jgi:probable rRNA maturation factor
VSIAVFNRQSRRRIDLERLQRIGEGALRAVMNRPVPGGREGSLADLRRVEVAIVGDAEIARVHEEFMGIAGPTDVITFDHGEIVISADRAAEEGASRRTGCDREIALYLVHGLLHLRGFDDATPGDARAMDSAQTAILGELWGEAAEV